MPSLEDSDISMELSEDEVFKEFQTEEECNMRVKWDYFLLEFLGHCDTSDWNDQQRIAVQERIRVLSERAAKLGM